MDSVEDKKPVSAEDETRIVMGFDEIDVNGTPIKVCEFTFSQELKALTIAEPIIKAIAQLYIDGDEPDMLVMEKVFAEHYKSFISLLSISTGKPAEYFELLPGKYASPIFLTFWGVNSHFFTQRIASQYIMAHPERLKTNQTTSNSANSAQH